MVTDLMRFCEQSGRRWKPPGTMEGDPALSSVRTSNETFHLCIPRSPVQDVLHESIQMPVAPNCHLLRFYLGRSRPFCKPQLFPGKMRVTDGVTSFQIVFTFLV